MAVAREGSDGAVQGVPVVASRPDASGEACPVRVIKSTMDSDAYEVTDADFGCVRFELKDGR